MQFGIHNDLAHHGGPPPPVTVLDFHEAKIGKTIDASKIRYTWVLAFGNDHHKIELTNTKMSGKKRIHVDGYLQHQQQVGGNEFFVGGRLFVVSRWDVQKMSGLCETLKSVVCHGAGEGIFSRYSRPRPGSCIPGPR